MNGDRCLFLGRGFRYGRRLLGDYEQPFTVSALMPRPQAWRHPGKSKDVRADAKGAGRRIHGYSWIAGPHSSVGNWYRSGLWEIPMSKGSKSPRHRRRRTGYFLAGSLDRLPGEYRVALVAEIPDDDGRCARDFLIAQPDEVLAATKWTGDWSSCRHEAQQEQESCRGLFGTERK